MPGRPSNGIGSARARPDERSPRHRDQGGSGQRRFAHHRRGMPTGAPSVESDRAAQARTESRVSVAMDGAQRQLWEVLQQSIAAAEQADRQLMAVSTVALSDSTYFQLTCAAERARQARLACDQ